VVFETGCVADVAVVVAVLVEVVAVVVLVVESGLRSFKYFVNGKKVVINEFGELLSE